MGKVLRIVALAVLYIVILFLYQSCALLTLPAVGAGKYTLWLQEYHEQAIGHLIMLVISPFVAALIALLARRYTLGWGPVAGSSGTLLVAWLTPGPVGAVEVVFSLALQALTYSAILTWKPGSPPAAGARGALGAHDDSLPGETRFQQDHQE